MTREVMMTRRMRLPARASRRSRQREGTCAALPLLAGFDTINWSSQARISAALRAKLGEEKAAAQVAAKTSGVQCPEWLGARVLPWGGRGYSFILETADFAVKIAGEHMATWPGIYCELRSFSLHAHEGGAQGALAASLAWVREKLLADQQAHTVQA